MDADQRPLEKLKGALRDKLPSSAIKEYKVHWDGERPSTDKLGLLVEGALALLKAAIDRELRDPLALRMAPAQPPRFGGDQHLDAEGRQHRAFAEERARIFEGREGTLAALAEYLEGDDPRPFVVHGKGGTGKSALIAEALARAQERDAELVYRFIGATPDSSGGRGLLRSLCGQLARRYGEREGGVPDDHQKLVSDFRERLQRAGAQRSLLLFVDSLDQLSPGDGARGLSWLPSPLPAGVRVVVSTRPGDTLEPLARRRARLEELGRLTRHEGERILTRWLADAHRDLQPTQRNAVLDRFEESDGNALWLRLAFEEARRWKGDEHPHDLAVGIAPEPYPGTEQDERELEGIIAKNTFARLAHEDNHGRVLVSRALGYPAASRYGLAEDELLDLLSRDVEVYRWFVLGTYHVPPDLVRLLLPNRNLGEDLVGRGGMGERELRRQASPDGSGRPDELDAFLTEVLPARDGPRLLVVLWSRLVGQPAALTPASGPSREAP